MLILVGREADRRAAHTQQREKASPSWSRFSPDPISNSSCSKEGSKEGSLRRVTPNPKKKKKGKVTKKGEVTFFG